MSAVLILVMILEAALLIGGYAPSQGWSAALCTYAFGLCGRPVAVSVALVVTAGLFFVQKN